MKVDLHGVKHGEVANMLASIIYDNPDTMISIITGNSEQMKQIVNDELNAQGLRHLQLLPTEITCWT